MKFEVTSSISARRATLFLITLTLYSYTIAIEPVSTVLGAGALTVAGFAFLYKPLYCRIEECCEDRWIQPTLPNLKASIEANVYGQHLVVRGVVNLLNGHLRHDSPKALVFSFQGWTGTGKNLVAQVIAENMYSRGLKSKYVHVLSATKHFSRADLAQHYKDQIHDWIIGNMSDCPRQLFIFDEVEKMPDGVLDVLKPFVDFYESLQGVDYRKAVYVLLGNAGGKLLFSKTFNHFKSGKKRHELEPKDIESTLWREACKEKGGLKDSSLIVSDLISAYVPFLPLEREHVKQCIENDIEQKNFTLRSENPKIFKKVVDEVMEQLSFTPPQVGLYSSTGCKRVHAKVNDILEKYREL